MKDLAQKTWQRYESSLERGHSSYQKQAKLCENMYLGGGRQWDEVDKAALNAAGKPWLEENLIFSTVQTVIGYQTQSRMDITYKPREDGDNEIAEVLSKLGMYVTDNNNYPWVEKQVFEDGMVQQRGYLDLRVNFDNNYLGEIEISSKDPLDIIPDQDSKSYDPDEWQDVMETRWMTVDDIQMDFGKRNSNKVKAHISDDPDFGVGELGAERNRFGTPGKYSSYYTDGGGVAHARVIERQWWKLTTRYCWVNLENGEIEFVPDDVSVKEARKDDREVVRKLVKRIRWTVSTADVVLQDDWSPYEHFTIIPFFPYFRRGVTLGLVDNLISTQQMLNKVYSQILHVINTTANSGWTVEQNSLTNMDTEDLESDGAKTGLVIEYKAGRQEPRKIEPNPIPSGLTSMMSSATEMIQLISGVTAAFKGEKGPEVSGDAIQSRAQQSSTQLAGALDNLFLTRHIFAKRLIKLIQTYYTEARTINIIGGGKDGEDEQIQINQETEWGEIVNDTTVGQYDVVVADVPTNVTFQNAQFREAIEMRKFGIQIPDDEMIRLSTLSRKEDIAKRVSGENPEAQEAAKAQADAQLEEIMKKIEKLEADARGKDVESVNKAAETAQLIVEQPEIVPVMQEILAQTTQPQQEEQQQQQDATLGAPRPDSPITA